MIKRAFREQSKYLFKRMPLPIKKSIVWLRDLWWQIFCYAWDHLQSPVPKPIVNKQKSKKRILFYALYGMRHAGTEKNLQLMANSLCKDYDVFYMFGIEPGYESRASVLDTQIKLIPFSFTAVETAVPHRITNMSIQLTDVTVAYKIDCLITASPGYSHYPWNLVRSIPIILLNIFGAPTLQPNIRTIIYNSQTTKLHAATWIGTDTRAVVQYAPLLNTPPVSVRAKGLALRDQLNIPHDAFVFGRIGRADDGIFDPIGIRAWQLIVNDYPQAHFIIMSPPPALVKIVAAEKIPRIHLLPPSNIEGDVWSFHGAIDSMAHFRFDGETSGVAIAESLYVGNPIISHRSHIWNAHTEYLTTDIARVVAKDDVHEYSMVMREYITIKTTNPAKWHAMQKQATMVAEKNFSPITYQNMTRHIVSNLLTN
jgi:hypothetical protein